MWWHETFRRVSVVTVYTAGLALAALPFVGTVQFLEDIGPGKASESRDVFWVGLLASILIITVLAHKLVNWIFQKGEWDGYYYPGHLTIEGDLRIDGGVETNSKVQIENVKVTPPKARKSKAD